MLRPACDPIALAPSFTNNDPGVNDNPPLICTTQQRSARPPGVFHGARAVVFGDSYISGEGAGTYDGNPVTAPGGFGCHDALGGEITGSPSAVVEPDGQREVFFNSNGRLGDAWFDLKRWNGPAILGGPVS